MPIFKLCQELFQSSRSQVGKMLSSYQKTIAKLQTRHQNQQLQQQLLTTITTFFLLTPYLPFMAYYEKVQKHEYNRLKS